MHFNIAPPEKDMSRATGKLQVTVPKAIAGRDGIRPGDEIEWVAAGETIRVVPPGRQVSGVDREMRLELFDAATERQRLQHSGSPRGRGAREPGWRREDLYERARAR